MSTSSLSIRLDQPAAARARESWQQLSQRLRQFFAARVSDRAASEDLCQDVLLKVLTRSEQLRDHERLTAWIFQIARRTLIDYFRHSPRAALLQGDDDSFNAADRRAAEDLEAAWREGGSSSPRASLAEWLRDTIETLEEPYREALILVEIEGRSQKQVAADLGISYSAMKSRVQRGRSQLAKAARACCALELDGLKRVIDCVPHAQRESCCSKNESTGAPQN